MFVSKNNFYISPEEYLEGERVSPIKHEYRRGHVYAMTGAKKPHIVISVNLASLLNNHLRESSCLVLSSDIKVRLEEANCYYYPDVAVTCDERDTSSMEDFILYPSLIIEVLSCPASKTHIVWYNMITFRKSQCLLKTFSVLRQRKLCNKH